MLERSGNERTTMVSPQRRISNLLVTRGSGGGNTEGQVWRKLMQITTSHLVIVAAFGVLYLAVPALPACIYVDLMHIAVTITRIPVPSTLYITRGG